MDSIRKECTLCEIKHNTRTNKADRIKCLRHYDTLVNTGDSVIAASTMSSGTTRRTTHCLFRSQTQQFRPCRFRRRARIEEGYGFALCCCGKGLIADGIDFEDIDPGTIVPHNAAKLEELWKELTSFFSIYEAKFRISGTHDQKFKRFGHGKADVLFDLKLWIVFVVECTRRMNMTHSPQV
ncbi:hypothetical protein PHMEG_0004462 [Phytophthora megakarya]|uniref:Uncharacterized protein n=1 Tax=Phytophthora megakarya TaxID=4795 RepID=A0A225WTQ7_9STRA|nr:hypothetical protein PHMEG_0004462 [Phytophthora megakarya]